MNPFTTFIILMVAFGLSWYTAHSMGRFWTESKIVGGSTHFMVIASLVLSGLGFTGVYFMLLIMVFSLFSTSLSGLDVSTLFPVSIGVLSMPGAGAVPSFWINGQVMTRRQQVLGAMNTPGLSLPLHPVDILDMTLNSGGLFRDLGSLFKGSGGGSGSDGGGDSDSGKLMLILLLIGLAILALMAGAVTTILIVQAADKDHVGEIIDMYKPLKAASS